jgi:hypothetical protein
MIDARATDGVEITAGIGERVGCDLSSGWFAIQARVDARNPSGAARAS